MVNGQNVPLSKCTLVAMYRVPSRNVPVQNVRYSISDVARPSMSETETCPSETETETYLAETETKPSETETCRIRDRDPRPCTKYDWVNWHCPCLYWGAAGPAPPTHGISTTTLKHWPVGCCNDCNQQSWPYISWLFIKIKLTLESGETKRGDKRGKIS